eukprot:jgi/Tetstr1/440559/TSEL_028880.t1
MITPPAPGPPRGWAGPACFARFSAARTVPVPTDSPTRPRPLSTPPATSIMSWQAYVDDHMLGELPNGGELTKAAIFSHEGDLWASSPGFPAIEEADFVHMMKAFSDTSQGEVAATGVKVAGEKFMFVRSDDTALLCRQGKSTGLTDQRLLERRDALGVPAASVLRVPGFHSAKSA